MKALFYPSVALKVLRSNQIVLFRQFYLDSAKSAKHGGAFKMLKRTQPDWSPPSPKAKVDLPNLKLYNSLTNAKEPFVPQNGKRVLWYSCGPTVYDASHMGHARSYISFDILRRVLKDYFKFDVHYVMNITDIDDKIIKRARQNYLFEQYSKGATSLEEIKKDIGSALEKTKSKLSKETDPDKRNMLEREVERTTTALNQPDASAQDLLPVCRDPLSDWLDSQLGSTVNDNAIFDDLPMHFEAEFHTDMAALNVLPADVLTRVREYVPQIVDYVQKIIDNGFAYESNGSVYFDTAAFASSSGHFYAKLVPTAFGDQELLQEGEGALSTGHLGQEKRSANDFALWKTSKPGEPAWPSLWGKGRPGWHIECSVMASDVLGSSLDIHTGGVDLKFPHHDNELAQAESYFGHSHWVRYFLHSGHLTISGCKMSKSLKNFITIRQALERHSARRLRLAFLLHSWKDTLDYSEDTMAEAISYEKTVSDFFFNVSHYERMDRMGTETSEDALDGEMKANLERTKTLVHEALCDSIDTREAMSAMRELISTANVYMKSKQDAGGRPRGLLLADCAKYITTMLRVFGAAEGDLEANTTGLDVLSVEHLKETLTGVLKVAAQFRADLLAEAKVENITALCDQMKEKASATFNIDLDKVYGSDLLSLAIPAVSLSDTCPDALHSVVMDALVWLATTRETARQTARAGKLTGALRVCDRLRDELLPPLGVRLEDREGEEPAVGLVSSGLLMEEKAEKAAKEEEKKRSQDKKKAEKEAQMRINPGEMFRSETDKFSQFDDKGMPTHDTEGKELSKSQLKKLQKIYDTQAKKYAEYLKTVANASGDPN